MLILKVRPLDHESFKPFGQLLAAEGDYPTRHNFAANLSSDRPQARPNLRVQWNEPTPLPHIVTIIERHRHSSQMFAPITGGRSLVIVFPSDAAGQPMLDAGHAFVADGNQAINYNANTWHHGFRALDSGAFLMLRWDDGTRGDEEFLTLQEPIRIET